jgi:hypothetical protein
MPEEKELPQVIFEPNDDGDALTVLLTDTRDGDFEHGDFVYALHDASGQLLGEQQIHARLHQGQYIRFSDEDDRRYLVLDAAPRPLTFTSAIFAGYALLIG